MKKLLFILSLAAAVVFWFSGCSNEDAASSTICYVKNWNSTDAITVQFKTQNGKSEIKSVAAKNDPKVAFSVDEFVSKYSLIDVYAFCAKEGDIYYYWNEDTCYIWSSADTSVDPVISGHSHKTAEKL